MNHAIIVAGGVGSRMNSDIPKQYLLVKDIPVFMYSFRKFVSEPSIRTIVLVVADEWRDFVQSWIEKEPLEQTVLFASAGSSRQHSVLNGLRRLQGVASGDDLVFVHDAVRPLFPLTNITDGIAGCVDYDATLPAITVKDATYQSRDGESLSVILPRQELFSGQSPECFRYGKFLKAHESFSDEEIALIRGSSELAFRAGLRVKLIPGTEQNFKITTKEDFRAFELIVN